MTWCRVVPNNGAHRFYVRCMHMRKHTILHTYPHAHSQTHNVAHICTCTLRPGTVTWALASFAETSAASTSARFGAQTTPKAPPRPPSPPGACSPSGARTSLSYPLNGMLADCASVCASLSLYIYIYTYICIRVSEWLDLCIYVFICVFIYVYTSIFLLTCQRVPCSW